MGRPRPWGNLMARKIGKPCICGHDTMEHKRSGHKCSRIKFDETRCTCEGYVKAKKADSQLDKSEMVEELK